MRERGGAAMIFTPMAYFVYELVCEKRKRIYIGVTKALDQELGRLRRNAPPEVADWPKDDLRKPRILEVCSSAEEARAKARRAAAGTHGRGWKRVLAADIVDA